MTNRCRSIRLKAFFICAISALLANGCATSTSLHQPRNYHSVNDIGSRAELAKINSKRDGQVGLAQELNRQRCSSPMLPRSNTTFASNLDQGLLSLGDILRVEVSDGKDFSGTVEITPSGKIDIPYLEPIQADGMTLKSLEDQVAHRLVHDGFYQRGFAMVTIERLATGPRRVSVGGAVFQPGVFFLNERSPESIRELEESSFGESASGATVSQALKRAAGIRPDADISNVVLTRKGERHVLDLSGAFNGSPIQNPIVLAGDEIFVPSRGCFQETLARSSVVTAPGVRLYMSNLTQPASSNAQSAINRDAMNFPYGTRLLQAVVSANCVGGAHVTNANRYVVFMTRDWDSGRTIVVERPIEALVRRADRDNFNPFLQEGDSLACYDSAVTNAREVLDMLSDAFSPAIFARGLLGN